jgi:hypothetical protein
VKYLKSFKIFESSSEDLLGTIGDILLPISDYGTIYNIRYIEKIGLVHIEIKDQNELINDCVDHLENYLKDLGYKYFVGTSIENEIYISIENNFNKEIEKDFLKIIEGIKLSEGYKDEYQSDAQNRTSLIQFRALNEGPPLVTPSEAIDNTQLGVEELRGILGLKDNQIA